MTSAAARPVTRTGRSTAGFYRDVASFGAVVCGWKVPDGRNHPAAAALLLLLALPASAQIAVTTATYGSNIPTVPRGNATAQVAAACNGLASCTYVIWSNRFIPDPAPGVPVGGNVG